MRRRRTDTEEIMIPVPMSCSLCDRPLTSRELEEFRSVADEELHGEVCCPACREAALVLCRECSCRYTVDGLCAECAAREYALAG